MYSAGNPAIAASLDTSTFTNHGGPIRCAPEQIALPVHADDVARAVLVAVAEGRPRQGTPPNIGRVPIMARAWPMKAFRLILSQQPFPPC